MSSDGLSPRVAVAVGILALVPVVWFGVAKSETAGVVSGVNVVLIIVGLAVAMGPSKTSGQNRTAA